MSAMKVLVAVEDDYFANEIVDFITGQQWPAGVAFHVLHVIEPPPPIPLPPSYHELSEVYWQIGTNLVRDVTSKLRNALIESTVLDRVVEGDPPEEIVQAATVWGANLIVLGARGRHGSRRFRLGSVSQAVSATAPCTVTIVRPAEPRKQPNEALSAAAVKE